MKRFLSCLLILLAFSCTKIHESNIPYVPVYLIIDLRFQDKDLVGLLHYKEITKKRVDGERTGYSGVLVVCGYNNMYYAYDLCCPNEASRNIKIVPDNTGHAKCPTCGTIYDTAYGSGTPTEGPSEYGLRRYSISSSGQEFIISN